MKKDWKSTVYIVWMVLAILLIAKLALKRLVLILISNTKIIISILFLESYKGKFKMFMTSLYWLLYKANILVMASATKIVIIKSLR